MRVRGWLAAGVCVAVLAGCTTSEPSPTPTVSATPASTPSPTPTEKTPTDLSDAALGIVFDDIPDVTGPAASAHDAVAIYRVEYWRSLTTGTVSPALAQFVSPELLRRVESGLQRNAEGGWEFDGTLRVRIDDVVVDGTTATARVCLDYADVIFTNADGSGPKSFADIDFPQFEQSAMRLSTSDEGVTWRPEDGTLEGNSCG